MRVDVAAGAEAIMKAVDGCGKLDNVTGEAGTNIGGMLEHVRQTMAELTNKPSSEIFIQDLLAVDTSVPVSVTGGLAGEFSLEQAVGIASMVKSDRLQMAMIAREIEQKLNIDVQIGGAEAEAAILGALTTPGTTDRWRSSTSARAPPMPPSSTLKVKSSPPISPGQATWSR